MWTAAILAGGQARRLGGLDKRALTVGAHSILDRQLAALRSLTPHILIVAGETAGTAAADTTVVTDRIAGAGALGGLYTALVAAPTEQVLVIACDMPFLTEPWLAYLADAGAADPAIDLVMPRDERGPQPLCASYHVRVAPALKARIDAGQLRVLDAIAPLAVRELGPAELAPFNASGRLLFNVNTPDDHTRAQQ